MPVQSKPHKKESNKKTEEPLKDDLDHSPKQQNTDHAKSDLLAVFDNQPGDKILEKLQFPMHPLLLASSLNHTVGIQKLLDVGVNINLQDEHSGNTALHSAAASNQSTAIELLIKKGANPAIINQEGNNPLMVAVSRNKTEAFNALWEHRSRININQANNGGQTALHLAADKSYIIAIIALLKAGAKSDMRCNDGKTVLMSCAAKGNVTSVQKLLDYGADVLPENDKLKGIYCHVTAVCSAVIDSKRELADMMVESLVRTNKIIPFIDRRIEILKKLHPDAEDHWVYFDTVLLPTLFVLWRNQNARKYLQLHNFYKYIVRLGNAYLMMVPNVTDDEMLEDIVYFLRQYMIYPEDGSVSDVTAKMFLESGGTELVIKAINRCGSCKDSVHGFFFLTPLIPLGLSKVGKLWLRANYHRILSSVSCDLNTEDIEHMEESRGSTSIEIKRLQNLWRRFKQVFYSVQFSQSSKHYKELLALEKAEKELAERKKQKKDKKSKRGPSMEEEQKMPLNEVVKPLNDNETTKAKESLIYPAEEYKKDQDSFNYYDFYLASQNFEKVLTKKEKKKKLKSKETSTVPNIPGLKTEMTGNSNMELSLHYKGNKIQNTVQNKSAQCELVRKKVQNQTSASKSEEMNVTRKPYKPDENVWFMPKSMVENKSVQCELVRKNLQNQTSASKTEEMNVTMKENRPDGNVWFMPKTMVDNKSIQCELVRKKVKDQTKATKSEEMNVTMKGNRPDGNVWFMPKTMVDNKSILVRKNVQDPTNATKNDTINVESKESKTDKKVCFMPQPTLMKNATYTRLKDFHNKFQEATNDVGIYDENVWFKSTETAHQNAPYSQLKDLNNTFKEAMNDGTLAEACKKKESLQYEIDEKDNKKQARDVKAGSDKINGIPQVMIADITFGDVIDIEELKENAKKNKLQKSRKAANHMDKGFVPRTSTPDVKDETLVTNTPLYQTPEKQTKNKLKDINTTVKQITLEKNASIMSKNMQKEIEATRSNILKDVSNKPTNAIQCNVNDITDDTTSLSRAKDLDGETYMSKISEHSDQLHISKDVKNNITNGMTSFSEDIKSSHYFSANQYRVDLQNKPLHDNQFSKSFGVSQLPEFFTDTNNLPVSLSCLESPCTSNIFQTFNSIEPCKRLDTDLYNHNSAFVQANSTNSCIFDDISRNYVTDTSQFITNLDKNSSDIISEKNPEKKAQLLCQKFGLTQTTFLLDFLKQDHCGLFSPEEIWPTKDQPELIPDKFDIPDFESPIKGVQPFEHDYDPVLDNRKDNAEYSGWMKKSYLDEDSGFFDCVDDFSKLLYLQRMQVVNDPHDVDLQGHGYDLQWNPFEQEKHNRAVQEQFGNIIDLSYKSLFEQSKSVVDDQQSHMNVQLQDDTTLFACETNDKKTTQIFTISDSVDEYNINNSLQSLSNTSLKLDTELAEMKREYDQHNREYQLSQSDAGTSTDLRNTELGVKPKISGNTSNHDVSKVISAMSNAVIESKDSSQDSNPNTSQNIQVISEKNHDITSGNLPLSRNNEAYVYIDSYKSSVSEYNKEKPLNFQYTRKARNIPQNNSISNTSFVDVQKSGPSYSLNQIKGDQQDDVPKQKKETPLSKIIAKIKNIQQYVISKKSDANIMHETKPGEIETSKTAETTPGEIENSNIAETELNWDWRKQVIDLQVQLNTTHNGTCEFPQKQRKRQRRQKLKKQQEKPAKLQINLAPPKLGEIVILPDKEPSQDSLLAISKYVYNKITPDPTTQLYNQTACALQNEEENMSSNKLTTQTNSFTEHQLLLQHLLKDLTPAKHGKQYARDSLPKQLPQWSKWRPVYDKLVKLLQAFTVQVRNIILPKYVEKFSIGTGPRGTRVSLGRTVDSEVVAVKRLQKTQLVDITMEAQKILSKKLYHPNIISLTCLVEDQSFLYLVTPLCECNLSVYLHNLGESTEEQHQQITQKLCKHMLTGLHYLHGQGIPHGNLKPENVLVDCHGIVRLCDYGLWKRSQGVSRQWRSTDVPAGEGTVRERCCEDIQVAGMLIYYILTSGQHPYGETKYEIEVNVTRCHPKLQRISPEADDLVPILLVKDPTQRPSALIALCHPLFMDTNKKMHFIQEVATYITHKRQSQSTISTHDQAMISHLQHLPLTNSTGTLWKEKVPICLLTDLYDLRERVEYDDGSLGFMEFLHSVFVIKDLVPDNTLQDILSSFPHLCMELYKLLREINQALFVDPTFIDSLQT